MADEFTASGNWWESSRSRYESGTLPSTSSGLTSIGSFGWLTDVAATSHDMKSRSSSMDLAEGSGSGALEAEKNLHMMNLGLSSQMDWNQPLLRGDNKGSESSFRSMLQQEQITQNHGDESGQVQWSSSSASENFIVQGLILGSENQHLGFENRSSINTCIANNNNYQEDDDDYWSKDVPQFLRAPRKPPPGQLQFSNNAPFWNASSAAPPDVRPAFLPPVQTPQNYEEKPNKNLLEANSNQCTTVLKKSGSEGSNKRPRNETQPLPAFKVKKEKMGDRITALQQLVSPYGKTDTASVLSEAIEYIKFLHEQVHVLSIPYMKSGVAMQHHQNFERSNLDLEGPDQDLRSRGLCLVPLSNTFPVTSHDTNIDFWNPTFGGTYR